MQFLPAVAGFSCTWNSASPFLCGLPFLPGLVFCISHFPASFCTQITVTVTCTVTTTIFTYRSTVLPPFRFARNLRSAVATVSGSVYLLYHIPPAHAFLFLYGLPFHHRQCYAAPYTYNIYRFTCTFLYRLGAFPGSLIPGFLDSVPFLLIYHFVSFSFLDCILPFCVLCSAVSFSFLGTCLCISAVTCLLPGSHSGLQVTWVGLFYRFLFCTVVYHLPRVLPEHHHTWMFLPFLFHRLPISCSLHSFRFHLFSFYHSRFSLHFHSFSTIRSFLFHCFIPPLVHHRYLPAYSLPDATCTVSCFTCTVFRSEFSPFISFSHSEHHLPFIPSSAHLPACLFSRAVSFVRSAVLRRSACC